MLQPPGEVTILLRNLSHEGTDEVQRLLPLVYQELRRLAAHYMQDEREGHTLQPTALVHEAYLKLVRSPQFAWQNKSHFIAIASQAMRRILTDHARTRTREKRGGAMPSIQLDDGLSGVSMKLSELLELDEALNRLAALSPRQCAIVEMREFGGLSVEETSAVLELSPTTVKREYSVALAWLSRELGGKP